MSHTTTRPRRFGRLAAGLTVAAAATATTLLGAAPAHAQTNTVTAVDDRRRNAGRQGHVQRRDDHR